jgi:MATE family multidrug resistance protein
MDVATARDYTVTMSHPQMTYRAHARALLALGLPLVGSSVAGFAIHMTDTIMLGWYSVISLAAATLATSFWFIIFIVGAGFGMAVMPLVAEAAEAGDEVRARRVTRMALWLSLAYGLAVLPILIWSGPLFLAMGQTPEIAAEAQRFLRLAGFAIVPALGTVVMRSYLAALHLTAVQLWITLVVLVLNALLNYAVIFGNWGAPEMGIVGSGLASVLMNTLTVVVMMVYAQWKLPQYSLFQRIWKADPGALARVFRLGLPIGMTSLAETGLFTASAIMMGWIGEFELAAHGIALQLAALMFMFHVGMSQAATIRAGGAYGRRDEAGLRRGAQTALAVSLTFGVFVVVVFLVMPAPLISIFLDPDDPARATILDIGIHLVAIAALFQMVDATQIIALSLLRGVQDTTVPMWLAGISYWLIGLPVAYLLAFVIGMGPVGLWLGLTAGLGAAAVLLMWRFWGRSVRITAPSTLATVSAASL